MHRHGHHDHESPAPEGHQGSASQGRIQRRLSVALALITLYMLAEIVGGWWANSLALLADAGHMFSDAASLALGLFAVWIGQRPPNARRSFGYYRAEILAALVNGATLLAVSVYIFYEAWERFLDPPEVQGTLMMVVAVGGLLINVLCLWILGGGHENLNVRAAWLHVLADTLGSVAAIGSGLLIWAFDWNWADPAASVLIGLLVIRSSWELLKEAVAVLMESTPGRLNLDEVRAAMLEPAQVRQVHDLHIWTITSGLESLSAHVVVDDERSQQATLKELRQLLSDRFGIDHVTLQIELPDFEEPSGPF